MHLRSGLFIVTLSVILTACGGGDGGGGGTTTASTSSNTLVDIEVANLPYTTSTNPGTRLFTGSAGQFQCIPGAETVTFYYGSTNTFIIPNPILCPATPSVVTTVSLLGASSVTDPSVNNLAQLLMTLDNKTNPNAITIPNPLPAGYVPANVPPFTTPNTTTFNTGLTTAFKAGTTITTPAQAAAQLAASFKTLTVTIVNNGSVTSSPAGINCPATCSFVFQTGTAVTLTAIGNGFTPGWSGGGCSGTGTCAVTMNADTAVTATFSAAPPPATLTITPAGNGTGTVTCNVNGGGFGACAGQYPAGTPLVLHGAANSGSTFTGFSFGTNDLLNCTGTADCSVTLNANSMVTATFTVAVTNFSVSTNTVSANGGTGQAQCSANGGQAGSCGSYPVGTQISIIPSSTNANFTGWTNGSGSGLTANCGGATGPCNFQLTSNTSITANFSRPTLTVQVSGTGSVSSNPTGINNCTTNCSSPFSKGTAVTLTASGSGFTGWTGDGCSATNPCVVPLNTDTTVTATFSQGGTTSTRWLFYTDNAGTIRYADPANPGATTTSLTTIGFNLNPVVTGTWDAPTSGYKNLTAPYIVYTSGGELWRVSAMKSSGVPGSGSNPPVQISKENAATTVCIVNEVPNTTVNNTKLLYELPGPDLNCGTQNDNVTKSVLVSDSATTPPTALAPGLVVTGQGDGPGGVIDLSTGLPTQVFLLDAANSNTLKLMNVNTNTISTIQTNVGLVDLVAQDTSDRVFLHGGPSRNILYLYTVSTNLLVPLVTGASTLHRGRPTGDGTNLYLAEKATGKLYKVPMTATASTDVVTLLTGVGFPLGDPCGGDDVVTTTNNVFLHTYVPGAGGGGCDPTSFGLDASGLYRVSKAGGAATPIIANATGTAIFQVFSAGSLLYYNLQLPPTIPQAVIINENGTSVFSSPASCFPCSGWVAVIGSPTFFVRSNDQPFAKVLLAALANSTFNGATLTAFDAPTGTQGQNLGIVPATTPTLASVTGADFLDTATLLVGQQNGSINNFIFFVDSVLAGSLTQVPTGTAAPWTPAGF